jgi:DNA polymerase sigma
MHAGYVPTHCNALIRSMAVLVQGFFHYFARDFDWDKHVVSVTQHGMVAKSSIAFHQGQHTFLCIQDPLDSKDNCARSVGQGTFARIVHEFERAYSLEYDALLQEARSAATRPSDEQREALKQVMGEGGGLCLHVVYRKTRRGA